MIPVVYVTRSIENAYEDGTFWGTLKDRIKISKTGDVYINELKLNIRRITMPPNFNKGAYFKNMSIANRSIRSKSAILAPKVNRILDYGLFTNFQKMLFGFSVAKSIELMLRISKKSIKSSCIVIYDAAEAINRATVFEISKLAKYIVLVSKDIQALKNLQNYIISEFGVTPVITSDINFAMKCADFVICSERYDVPCEVPVWYIDNNYIPEERYSCYANDVVYKTPWDTNEISMSTEVLGAILYQMHERDIEKALKNNGIYLNQIKFNDLIL